MMTSQEWRHHSADGKCSTALLYFTNCGVLWARKLLQEHKGYVLGFCYKEIP